MGVYNNNKDGTRSTLANTIQVVDAPMEQFVSRGEFNAVVPSDTSADNKLVNSDKFDTNLNDIWKANGELGAKNLLPYPYYSGVSKTDNGITFTDNGDGSVTVNGTSTGNAQYFFVRGVPVFLPKGRYIMSVSEELPVPFMWVQLGVGSSTLVQLNQNNISRAFEIPTNMNGNIEIKIIILANMSFNNAIIRPMIRLASDTDDTWQPYAMTNRELSKHINDVINRAGNLMLDYEHLKDELEYKNNGLYSRASNATVSDNIATVTGVNGGIMTNEFTANSNVVKIAGKVTFSTPNCRLQLGYFRDNSWYYTILTSLNSGEEFEASFDAAHYSVYNGVEKFLILFNTTTVAGVSDYSGTIEVNSLSVINTTQMQQSEYYDSHFQPMMQKVFNGINDAKNTNNTQNDITVTNTSGEKFIVGMGANDNIIFIPIIPNKTLFCGNSLLLGMNTSPVNKQYVYGMCATAPENDFCHKMMTAIQNKKSSATYDRVHGAQFEGLASTDSFNTLWNTTPNIYTENPLKDSFTNDLDLIVIQLGDNVNTADRRAAFANNIDDFLHNIRTSSPNARIVWVYGWFIDSVTRNIIEQACGKWSIQTINISSLHIKANEGVSGQTYVTSNGTTAVVPDTWITHPGDNGMQAIADKIIEVLNM